MYCWTYDLHPEPANNERSPRRPMASAFISIAHRHRHHAALLGLLVGHLRCASASQSQPQPAHCSASGTAERPEFEDGTGRPLNQAARDLFAAATGADVPPPASGRARLSHAAAEALLEGIPAVEVAYGTWKYVQIELRLASAAPERAAAGHEEAAAGAAPERAAAGHEEAAAGAAGGKGTVLTKQIVRSVRGAKYHADCYRSAMQRILAENVTFVIELSPGVLSGVVIGGGRIQCDDERKTASVYGYSQTFGRVVGCNKRSAGLISTHLGYKVQWSDDGY